DHPHHVQPVERGREDVEEQTRRRPGPVQRRGIDEGVVQPVAGREQYEVVVAGRAIAEVYGVPVEARDVATKAQIALPEVAEDESGDDGMRLVDLVVRRGEAELYRVARECTQDSGVDELLDGPRQRAALVEGVAGPAEQVAGHEVIAPAHAHI